MDELIKALVKEILRKAILEGLGDKNPGSESVGSSEELREAVRSWLDNLKDVVNGAWRDGLHSSDAASDIVSPFIKFYEILGMHDEVSDITNFLRRIREEYGDYEKGWFEEIVSEFSRNVNALKNEIAMGASEERVREIAHAVVETAERLYRGGWDVDLLDEILDGAEKLGIEVGGRVTVLEEIAPKLADAVVKEIRKLGLEDEDTIKRLGKMIRFFFYATGPTDDYFRLDRIIQRLERGEKSALEELKMEIKEFVEHLEVLPNIVGTLSLWKLEGYCGALYRILRKLTDGRHPLLDEYYDVLLKEGIAV